MVKGQSPLRKTVRSMLAAAAIGLILTVLVAWVAALAPAAGSAWPSDSTKWPGCSGPPGWPARLVDYEVRDGALSGDGVVFHSGSIESLARQEIEIRALRWSDSTATESTTYTFTRRSAGWPWLGLCTDQTEEVRSTFGSTTETTSTPWDSAFHQGMPIPFLTRLSAQDRRLPIKPIWPGFALNWLTYSGTLLALFTIRAATRHLVRTRRGLDARCPNCGYSLTGLTAPSCPECGNPVPVNSPSRPAPHAPLP